MKKNKLVIYENKAGEAKLEVSIKEDTVWLTQKQMATLFNKDIRTINEHIANVYKEKELDLNSTLRNFRIVQKEGARNVQRSIDHYNLDVIISVGYRVKSKQGTQFRIWANRILKQYLLEGYVVNEKLLAESQNKLKELKETIHFLSKGTNNPELEGQEKELFSVLDYYSNSISILGKYDSGKLRRPKGAKPSYELTYKESKRVINELKKQLSKGKEAGALFGSEIDTRFQGALSSIYQTFDGVDLYRSIEEKAAHLLYFLTKDHPFSDGNKRIASILFVYFLEKNNYLYRKNGERKINDSALVAIAILTASSNPKDKEVITRLIMSLIR
ncbi:MAG: virulence protein RhuM/Fic/DOC family protein [Patescibacteria group bacterium]|nr:virulence protein RhuM/Fic/DOC family protein [Patescibacteria group bacterium]